MARKTASAIYGNLDLLILHTLSVTGSSHGLGIIDSIEIGSEGIMRVEDGALYRALHRLEEHGLLKAEWRISDKNRKAKFYALTPAGEEELWHSQEEWTRHTRAISKVLGIGWEIPP
ncbi:MAG: PadR family transcriptional regulator [Gemmatimonadota bacterium]|nr:MAG: PadR family transcriptional regulator [Gemmatimonadota bacterium]